MVSTRLTSGLGLYSIPLLLLGGLDLVWRRDQSSVFVILWIAIVFPWYAKIVNKTVGLGSNALVAVQAPLDASALALFNVNLDANDLSQLNATLKPEMRVVFNTSLDRDALDSVDHAAYANALVALKSPLDPNGFATLNKWRNKYFKTLCKR